MTDIEVFKKFMSWMQLEIKSEKKLQNGNTILIFEDTGKDSEMFTKVGYDDFYSGIMFDIHGTIVKGYLDSHVSYESKNCKLLNTL